MRIRTLIISVLIPIAGGAIVGFIVNNSTDVYMSIQQPALAPPGWLFPVVWTVLYALMGISSYLIYTSNAGKEKIGRALAVYAVQLAVNLIWPFLFFGLDNYLISFVWIVFLWMLIIVMIYMFYKISKPAAYLIIPYLIWVTFAAYLNLSIYIINS